MQTGDKTRYLNKEGLTDSAKNVNILRNFNIDQSHFESSFGQTGVNVALANPYEAQTAFFTSEGVGTFTTGQWLPVPLVEQHMDVIFGHNSTSTSPKAKSIVTFGRSGKYLINYQFTIKFHDSSYTGHEDPKWLSIRCYLFTGDTNLEFHTTAEIFVPGTHGGAEEPEDPDFPNDGVLTDLTIDFDAKTFTPTYVNLKHLPDDVSGALNMYATGSGSAIIDVDDDLNDDAQLRMRLLTNHGIPNGASLVTTATGMTIVGPLIMSSS